MSSLFTLHHYLMMFYFQNRWRGICPSSEHTTKYVVLFGRHCENLENKQLSTISISEIFDCYI